MDNLHERLTDTLKLDLPLEDRLSITRQPPQSCPYNNELIDDLKIISNRLEDTKAMLSQGEADRFGIPDLDTLKVEALREVVDQMMLWKSELIDSFHYYSSIEGFDVDETGLRDVIMAYPNVFSNEEKHVPELIMQEAEALLNQAMDDVESGLHYEEEIISKHEELKSAIEALEVFERITPEPDEQEEADEYELWREESKLLQTEIEDAEADFDESVSEMRSNIDSAIEKLDECIHTLDKQLRNQMDVYRHAMIDLKDELIEHLPKEVLNQPSDALRERGQNNGLSDDNTLYVATWDRLCKRLLDADSILISADVRKELQSHINNAEDIKEQLCDILFEHEPNLQQVIAYDSLNAARLNVLTATEQVINPAYEKTLDRELSA